MLGSNFLSGAKCSASWIVSLSLVTVVFFSTEVKGLIPKVCVQNITATGGSGVCCPVPKGSIHPCGGIGIGTCQRQFIQHEPLHSYLQKDDRMQWPSRFFKYMCQCEGNYFGVGCETCWFGWKGANCNKQKKTIRRDIMSYTPEERQKFVNIVAKMPDTPTDYLIIFEKDPIYSDPLWKPRFIEVDLQYYIAYIHRYSSRATLYHSDVNCDRYVNLDNNHNVVGFSTWHRYMMLFWERQLQKIAKRMYGWTDFGIPYWDWVDSTKCDVCVNSLVGAPGPWVNGIRLLHPDSPFHKWTEQCTIPSEGSHCYGCHASWPHFKPLNRHYKANEFPGTDELQFALSRKRQVFQSRSCMSEFLVTSFTPFYDEIISNLLMSVLFS